MQALRSTLFLLYGNSNFTHAAFLAHAKSFLPGDTMVDMSGKVCIITGANQGIGKAAAHALASRGATVHIVCRNKERGEEAAEEIKKKTNNQHVHVEVCDLSSSAQVRVLAASFAKSQRPLHLLVNNAGIMEQQLKKSEDGFELNFAVNVFGTFLLTELMLPALQRAAPESKVVTVATGGILTQPLSTDLQMEKSKFDGTEAYARNKRVQVVLTQKWAEQHAATGVGFFSMHPGWVDTTTLQNSMPGFYNTFKSSLRTPDQGADTIAWLAMQPNSKLTSGAFYFDRDVSPQHLPLAGTQYKLADVDEIYLKLRGLSRL